MYADVRCTSWLGSRRAPGSEMTEILTGVKEWACCARQTLYKGASENGAAIPADAMRNYPGVGCSPLPYCLGNSGS